MAILLGMIACLAIIYAVPFAENAKQLGQPLQCAETFTALMSWRFAMLLFSTALLLLFGDLPAYEPFTANALMRGTRRSWMCGQMLYIALTALLMTALVFGVTVAAALPNLSLTDEWSRPVLLQTLSGRTALSPDEMQLTLSRHVVSNYTPWQAFGISASLFWLMGLVYGLASLVARMKLRNGSFVLLVVANAISWAMGMFSSDDGMFAVISAVSVHYHASLEWHQVAGSNRYVATLGASYAVLAIAVLALVMVALTLVGRYDYTGAEVDLS